MDRETAQCIADILKRLKDIDAKINLLVFKKKAVEHLSIFRDEEELWEKKKRKYPHP